MNRHCILRGTALAALFLGTSSASEPRLVVVGGVPHKAYVSNTGDGTITVVDLDTMTAVGAPIDVGNGPRGGAVHPDLSKVYIVNQQADDLMVFDTTTDALITRTPVGGRPFRCGISPDGSSVYVACHTGHDVWKLDTSDNSAAEVLLVPGGGMQDAKVSPDGTKVLAMNNNTNEVDFFGTADDQIIGAAIGVGTEPHCVAYSTDGATAIVVGDNDAYFIDVSTHAVLGTVPANGQHEEVRVAGNLAYATNLLFPTVDKLVVPNPTTGLDVFDMTTHEYLRSIPMGGDGANGLELSPDGETVWVTMRNSNELREVNLVTELETGRSVSVGAAPRAVTVAYKTPETDVVSYFLPRTIAVKIFPVGARKRPSGPRDSLVTSGFYDDGNLVVDYSAPVTLDVGGFERTFTLVPNKKRTTYKFVDKNVRFTISPNLRGSSRGLFRLLISKTTLASLVDPNAAVEFHFHASGLPDAQGKVTLTRGKYRLGKKRGALLQPRFYPVKAGAKLGGDGLDSLSFVGGFATDGTTPATLGAVRFAFGAYSRTIPGASFKKIGDAFTFKAPKGEPKFSIKFDFLRETVRVSASKIELGSLAGPATDVVLDVGGGPVRDTIRLSSKGVKRFY